MSDSLLADYYTKGELAAEMNVSERTLDRWHNRRMGPLRTRLGSRILYKKTTVAAWIEAQEEAVAQRDRRAA